MKKTMIAIACLLLLAGACWSQDIETNGNEVKYYDNAKVVRIKNVDGEGFVQRSYEEGNEEATANLPLFEKDTVGTTEGRLGIYLGRLNYLRLDANSTVVLEKIPELRKTDLSVRVENGGIYLDIESLDNERGIEIQTPDCGVFILDKGVYRVNVSRDSQTEVLVLEGIAEVTGRDSSRDVRENQKIVMAGGEISERPYYFTASEKDDFDSWNEAQNREQSYAQYGTSRYLQSGYEDTEYEMSRSGRWSYMSEYNSYAWMPYNTNSDWMPYANGRWVWNPYYGYTWDSYDSCGWFTHHYGRWQWGYSSGWYWLPGYHWSPAWVSWFGNNNYYGWCPLSWWNRPVVVLNNRWDRNYDYRRGIPFHSRSTIIIRKNELSAANAQRVALNRNTLGRNGTESISYRGTAPSERLAPGKITVLNAEGRAMSYKQGGIVSSEKYRASNSANGRATEYKYNPVSKGTYSDSAYRKKNSERLDQTNGGNSTYGSKGSATSRSRYNSSGATEKAADRAGYGSRAKNSGSERATSSSSSSSSSSTEKAKKKKDAPSYMSATGYGQDGTEKASASTYARYQSKYSDGGNTANRSSYRAYESRFKSPGNANAGSYSAGSSRYRAESGYASGLSSGRYSGSSLRSNSADRFSSPDSSYRANRSTANESLRGSSYGGSGSSASYGRESGSRSSVRSYTPAASSQSFRSSRSSYSAPSSTHSGTAVHKKDKR